jgi:hypothetical protein
LLQQGISQGLVALVSSTRQLQQQQWQHWQWRSVWNDSIDKQEARRADSFYDSTIERVSQAAVPLLRLLNSL